jgi:hypothetical protein
MQVHTAENNQESRANLERNRVKFSRKCLETYQRLMRGEELTVLGAANSGISSLPRRVADLKAQGVAVKWYWQGSYKVYLMTASDKEANRAKFPSLFP